MRLNKWGQYAAVINTNTYNLDISLSGIYSISGSAASKKITAFTGVAGCWAILYFTDSNVTIDAAAAKLHGNVDFVAAAGDVLFIATHDGTTFASAGWQQQAGTAVNTPVASLTVTGAFAANGGITCDTNKFTVADSSGDVLTAGTLTVAGAAALNGGITCDTTAFTVADTTGAAASATSMSAPLLQVNGANSSLFKIQTATASTAALSGATGTLTDLIPAGSLLLGVTTRVTTLITSGDGSTAFTLGDGTTADLFGTALPFTLGATTTMADMKSTFSPKIYQSATSIVLTATGGTFSAGVLEVVIYYASMTAPAS